MAIRIEEPNIDHTETLLSQVLNLVLQDEVRAGFLCDSGTGHDIVQRLRTMLSRKRALLMRKGKKPRRFKLRATIHPETHNGKRFDCVIMWKQVEDFHTMTEALEDILSHG